MILIWVLAVWSWMFAFTSTMALGQSLTEDDDCWADYPHCYDIDDTEASTMEVVVGRIISISETPLCSGQDKVVTLALRSEANPDSAVRDVFLAPKKFLDLNGLTFTVGDEVAVLGVSSWNTVQGHLTVIKVALGSKVSYLRDPSGRPLWLGSRPAS